MSTEPVLHVFERGRKIREIAVGDAAIVLGRDPKCTINLEDQMVSRNHAEIKKVGDAIEVLKKSRFGWMKLNGREVEQGRLVNGDRLEVGPFEIVLKTSTTENAAVVTPVVPMYQGAGIQSNEILNVSAADSVEFKDHAQNIEHGNEQKDVQSNQIGEIPGFSDSMEPVEVVNHSFDSNEQPADNKVEFGLDASTEQSAQNDNPYNSQSNADQSEHSNNPSQTGFVNQGHASFLDANNSNDGTKVLEIAQNIQADLIFQPGAANVQHYSIAEDEISIGRSPKCHVVLEDIKSSRKHAILRRNGMKFILSDLGSINGTYLNGTRIDQVELSSGDTVKIGDTEFKFEVRNPEFDQRKDSFLQVEQPVEEVSQVAAFGAPAMPNWNPSPVDPNAVNSQIPGQLPGQDQQTGAKKSLFKLSFLENIRTRPIRVQLMYFAAIIAVFYLFLFEDAEEPPPPASAVKKVEAKKEVVKAGEDKKGTAMPTFESLTPEQKKYVETQYDISMEAFRNREYEKCIFEITKIFALVQDYKNSRELESYAREAQRKLAAEEEKRKRLLEDKAKKEKIESLLVSAGKLMTEKKYAEAEMLFPEIEILEPENGQVGQWRDTIFNEREAQEKIKEAKRKFEEFHKKINERIADVLAERAKTKDYYAAVDQLEAISKEPIEVKSIRVNIQNEIEKSYSLLASERDPLLASAVEAEQAGNLSEAFRFFRDAKKIDSESETAIEGMKRIRGILTVRAKHLYTEGVVAESYGDFDIAEEKYKQVQKVAPEDDAYYEKATSRLRKLTVLTPPKEAISEN